MYIDTASVTARCDQLIRRMQTTSKRAVLAALRQEAAKVAQAVASWYAGDSREDIVDLAGALFLLHASIRRVEEDGPHALHQARVLGCESCRG